MKRFLLIVLLLVSVYYFVSQRYSFAAGKDVTGKFSVMVVEKMTGRIYKIIGH